MSQNLNYGINSAGFKPKPIDVIEANMKDLTQQFFGTSVDLSQQSPLWKMEQVSGTEISQLWLIAELNFYNCFIQTAEGAALDLLGDDIGLERKDAISAVAELTIYKNTTSQVTVPLNSLFETSEGIIFQTLAEITIAAGAIATEVGTVNVEAINGGDSGNVGIATILTPTNTISGIASSTNAAAATGGEDAESDEDYRKRLSEFVRATWTVAAIRSAALNVDGVDSVKVIEAATSYQVLVVPKTNYTPELEAEVLAAVSVVNPITVEYFIIEAEKVKIYITATVVLQSLYDISTAQQDAEVEITEYLTTLGIDDDVINSKIIQAIMEVEGILNVYSLVLEGRPFEEKHTYATGTLTYNLDVSTGSSIDEVKGTLATVEDHVFIPTTDYTFSGSPAQIIWTGTGDLPDNGTDFKVTYRYPANGIGDIEINQDDIAVFGDVTFSL